VPFLDPSSGDLNIKIVFFGPDDVENARRLRVAYERAVSRHASGAAGVRLRQVHGDGKVFVEGATVLFFDAPLDVPPFHGHPLVLHLFALEGTPRAEHLAMLLRGVDGVVFSAGETAHTPTANLENLRAFLRQADHALPTVVTEVEADEPALAALDRAVDAVRTVFDEYLTVE
jgi:hypothetical protein